MKLHLLFLVAIFASGQLASSDELETADKLYQEALALKYSDKAKSVSLFVKAAKLKHPDASGVVADLVKSEGFTFSDFGATREAARVQLLRVANEKRTPETKWQLGNALLKVGNRDEGLDLLKEASEARLKIAWKDYFRSVCANPTRAHRVDDGYFFLVAYLQFIDPKSLAGEDAWTLREKISKSLSMESLNKIHNTVDNWILEAEPEKSVPFGLGKSSRSARANAAAAEIKFRQAMQGNQK